MKRTTLMAMIVAFTAALTLSACYTTHPNHPHGCPPGQAKKGNC